MSSNGKEKGHSRRKHQGREDLVGEYRWGALGQIIFIFIFLAVWITDSFFMRRTTFPAGYVPLYLRIPVALAVLVISGSLARSGLRKVFGEERDEPGVMDEGVFSMVRHPVYLGSVLLYLGLLISTLSLMVAFVWICIIAFYHFLSRYEERLLLRKFGNEYREYMEKVSSGYRG